MSLQNGNANKNGSCITEEKRITFKYTRVREPFKLILQLLYVLTILLPVTIWSIWKYFYAPEKSLKGQTVLVTGGAQGLGREMCFRFAELGCSIACVDINDEASHETVETIKNTYPGLPSAFSYHCDVTSKDEIKKLHAAVKKDLRQIDILVHNAGEVTAQYLTTFEDKYLDHMIDLNLKSHFWIYREFLPEMQKRNSGHIVAIASLASVFTVANFAIYTATKHGVLGLMESLQLELNQRPNNNVKATSVCPYFIYTNKRYIKEWDLRMPGLSVKKTARCIVKGIRQNKRVISIPSTFYWLCNLLRLFPFAVSDQLKKIFYVYLTPAKDTKVSVD